jgi:hypothetical protein
MSTQLSNRTSIMSLDLSNSWRDDAHQDAQRRLCPDRKAWRGPAPPSRREPSPSARVALALVADVVMVSIAAAVAIVAVQSFGGDASAGRDASVKADPTARGAKQPVSHLGYALTMQRRML